MPCAALSRRIPARSRSSAASGPKRATCQAPTVRCVWCVHSVAGIAAAANRATSSSSPAGFESDTPLVVSFFPSCSHPTRPASMFATRSPSSPARRAGLGRACAIALAQAGADVALGYRDARADGGTTDGDPRARAPRAAAADGRHARRPRSRRGGRGGARVRPHRHPDQQRGDRSAQRGRGGHRGRLRCHAGGEPEGDILRQPGGRAA